jgi:hypothetical protein
MPNNGSSLPLEILNLIFSQDCLNNANLSQCQLVCKEWEKLAQKYCYQHVHLNTFEKSDSFFKTLLTTHTAFAITSLHLYNLFQRDVDHLSPPQHNIIGMFRRVSRTLAKIQAN